MTAQKGETTISFIIGTPSIIINGEQKQIDVAPCEIDGRTLIPVRAISEAYNMKVDWDDSTQTVFITYDKTGYERLKDYIISK